MHIDQLALLFGLVIAAYVVVLVALGIPTVRRLRQRDGSEHGNPVGTAHPGPADVSPTPMAEPLYQRLVRVVSFIFIGSVMVIETVNEPRPAIYVLAVIGLFGIVLLHDVLPSTSLGRYRLPLEAILAIGFVTVLLVLTGGVQSPYFFGYVVLLFAASLWASGIGAPLLAVSVSLAYLVAILIAPGSTPFSADAISRVAINLITLAMVTYLASLIGREQRRAREEALRLSRFDAMTGLHSRGFFESAVEQEILRAQRSGRGFALVMVDLDGLKAANDRFGHASGDRLLRAVGDVLRGDVRVTDVAARYGGDEFVLILPETDLAGALLVADKVRVDINRLALPYNGAMIRTSASIGVVTYPEDGRESSELLRRADLAMYEAKRRGRDQIVRYARETPMPMAPPGAGAHPSPVATGPQAPAAGPVGMPRGPGAPSGHEPPPTTTGPPLEPVGLPQPTTAQQSNIPPESPRPAPWETRATRDR